MRLFAAILAFAALVRPALAHDDAHHGLPGAAHALSADHMGWALLCAGVLVAVLAFRRPFARTVKARMRR